MKAYFNQLSGLLNKGLSNFYLITGDEPLQRMEAADMIRAAAYEAGYHQRELFFAEKNFDWKAFSLNSSNISMLAEKRLLDIRLQVDKLSEEGSEFLKSVLDKPHADCLFLVQANKVDGRSAWVKKASAQGVWVPVYPKNLNTMKAWLTERVLRKGLVVEDGVTDLIAQYTEGNMLVAAQELDKMALSVEKEDSMISVKDVQAIMSNSAQYTAWDLADAVVTGEKERALRIFYGLQFEDAPLPLILWALADHFRQLADVVGRIEEGESADTVLEPIWRNRQAIYRKAIARKLQGKWWSVMLHSCYQVDRAMKGHGQDTDWNELLCLIMRAVRIPPLKKPAVA